MARLQLGIACLASGVFAAAAVAQIDPSGIDFSTIGSPGNIAYNRDDPQGLITGRGSVSYPYRMSTYEITTSEWLDFYNTFKARSDAVPDSILPPPVLWGAQVDPDHVEVRHDVDLGDGFTDTERPEAIFGAAEFDASCQVTGERLDRFH